MNNEKKYVYNDKKKRKTVPHTKIVKNCFLHIPNKSSGPIQWMEIKDENNNNETLLYIPYISEFKQARIKNFEHAVYKNVICLEDSFDDQIISLIESMYIEYKDVILVDNPREMNKDQEITFNIDIQNYESLTQLYFLNKLSLLGNVFIDGKKMVVKIENYVSKRELLE